jgi:uncharacterized protein (TIGR02266 family)
MSALEVWYVREEPPTSVGKRPEGLIEERRSGARLPIELDVDVEGAAHRFRSNTANLSAGGMFIVTHRDIPLGTHVMLGFKLPNGAALEVIGVVRWRRDKDADGVAGLGIAFFCLEPEAKKTIQDFCGVREAIYAAAGEGAPRVESGEFEAVTSIPKGDDD